MENVCCQLKKSCFFAKWIGCKLPTIAPRRNRFSCASPIARATRWRKIEMTGVCDFSSIGNYSKARKYVDISGGTNLTPPLARFVTSPIRDVQVIVDFTIIGVDFASRQEGSSSDTGHLTIDFHCTSATCPAAKYYFAIVGEGEAYNQADWRNRSLSRFLQVVKVS